MKRDLIQQIEDLGNHIKSRVSLFEKFVKDCPSPVAMIDTDFTILLYSNSFRRFFDFEFMGTLVGKNIIKLFNDDLRTDRFISMCENLKESQALVCDFENVSTASSSRIFKFSWRVEKFFLENGERYHAGYFLLIHQIPESSDSEWKIIEI